MSASVSIYYPCGDQPKELLVKRFLFPTTLSKEEFDKYYQPIYRFVDTFSNINLETIFTQFNSETNPLWEENYQKEIERLKSHTAMSMGDIIKVNNNYYIINSFGFKQMNF